MIGETRTSFKTAKMGAPLVQPTTAPVEHVTILASDEIEKPDLDTRAYRVIRLPNQLEAMLISDPETDKSSAALDVNVGYYNDPPDIPGLAHTLEHLLFMGTEKVCQRNQTKTNEADSKALAPVSKRGGLPRVSFISFSD